ncbi:MAG TPA: succinate dehydrogenase cytochrome b subunit [Candidatus Eisenbacteria bacterium]|nr:succinate dehydrogenase cytochrome b subunit [Candidatus Eisenbacteria bacterium]
MERTQVGPGQFSRAEPFAASTIGKKVVMAVTGFILFGFVVAHMIGNLQAYLGPEALNAYAVWLRELLHGAGLWIARAVLLLSVILHIWSATALTIDNRRARPVGYRRREYDRSTYASRTMVWSGPILLLFIIYHLLHFTFGTVHPSFVEGNVYHNFVAGFQVVPVSIFYIVAMLALGYHLYHGIWSMLQTLGLSHPRYNFLRHGFAGLMTAIVVVGNISFPLAVLTGVIR